MILSRVEEGLGSCDIQLSDGTRHTCRSNMSRLIRVLEITNDVVNKEPWIKESGL